MKAMISQPMAATRDIDLRTCDLCENASYVDLLDGRSVLVCDGTATDESAHEVRETDSCDNFALYIGEEVAGDDEQRETQDGRKAARTGDL